MENTNMQIKNIGSNQTQVETKRGVLLVSYETVVAAILHDKGLNPKAYRTSKKWSVTTSRHINKWLDGREAEEKEQEFFDNLIK